MPSFQMEGKQIDVLIGNGRDLPIIYLNTFAREGREVYEETKKLGCQEFHLVAVGNLDWDSDMTPWDAPPLSKDDTPSTGGADNYLQLLTEQILPKAEQMLEGAPSWRGIAGYSLGGLFAIYCLYRTTVFSRAASMSGSFWFPDIKEYIFSHELKRMPDSLYFSIGNKEAKTRNPYLRTVQKNTEDIEAHYRAQGIATVFKLNPGNHFVDASKRTAAGLAWLLGKE